MGDRVRYSDWLLPLLVCGLGLVELASLDGLDGRPAAAAALVLACGLLVLRRRWPLVAATSAAVVYLCTPFVGPAYDEAATGLLVLVTAIYALARWVPDLRGALGVLPIWLVTLGGYTFADTRPHGLDDVVFVLAFTVPPYVLGRVVRRLADYNDLLARQQDLVRREAVRDERERIAREMHDVIAHSLSVMVVQTAAARDLVARDPARAQEILDQVAGTGRGAISETGRLLHVLRDTDDELALAPAHGLRDLDDLVTEFERDGLAVDLVVDGVPEDVPAAVDASAYRIAREALTNALRYAADGSVRIEIAATEHGLTIRTVNHADGATGLGSGLGLIGLQERVGLLGGTLSHGRGPHGDYELVATLPLARETV